MAGTWRSAADYGGPRASDLHIKSGRMPQIRVSGRLTQLTQFEVLSLRSTQRLSYSVLKRGPEAKFEEDNELDLSFASRRLARFRCQRVPAARRGGSAIRVIPLGSRRLCCTICGKGKLVERAILGMTRIAEPPRRAAGTRCSEARQFPLDAERGVELALSSSNFLLLGSFSTL